MLSDTYYWYFLQLALSKIKKLEVKIYIPLSAESFSAIHNALSSTVLMWERMKVILYRVSEKNVLASGKMLPNVRKKVVKTVSLLFPVSNPVGYAPFERNMN